MLVFVIVFYGTKSADVYNIQDLITRRKKNVLMSQQFKTD